MIVFCKHMNGTFWQNKQVKQLKELFVFTELIVHNKVVFLYIYQLTILCN
jgi:hypothetical protein